MSILSPLPFRIWVEVLVCPSGMSNGLAPRLPKEPSKKDDVISTLYLYLIFPIFECDTNLNVSLYINSPTGFTGSLATC